MALEPLTSLKRLSDSLLPPSPSQREIVRETGVSAMTVQRILKRREQNA